MAPQLLRMNVVTHVTLANAPHRYIYPYIKNVVYILYILYINTRIITYTDDLVDDTYKTIYILLRVHIIAHMYTWRIYNNARSNKFLHAYCIHITYNV